MESNRMQSNPMASSLATPGLLGRRLPGQRVATALRCCVAVLALSLASAGAAAHDRAAASVAASSAVPVAVSVAAPAMLLSGTVVLTLVAIDASARGTVWVLQRASDGARFSVRFAGDVVSGAAASVGTAVVCTVLATGWLLSAAGEAIAFVPNEIGASLMHDERITR